MAYTVKKLNLRDVIPANLTPREEELLETHWHYYYAFNQNVIL